jgi:hypothetical protein
MLDRRAQVDSMRATFSDEVDKTARAMGARTNRTAAEVPLAGRTPKAEAVEGADRRIAPLHLALERKSEVVVVDMDDVRAVVGYCREI